MVATQDENEKNALEFIVGQLLTIAQSRDFSDEVGRRELLAFLRSFLINTDASEEQILTACRGLRKMSNDEVDFLRYKYLSKMSFSQVIQLMVCRMVAEILYDVDEADGEEFEVDCEILAQKFIYLDLIYFFGAE
jgi:hypothetical protein